MAGPTRRQFLQAVPTATFGANNYDAVTNSPGKALDGTTNGSVDPSPGGSRPAMFVHLDELAAIREKVEESADPWQTAYDRLMRDVATARSASPASVTDSGDGNQFRTGGPDSDSRDDYVAAIRMGDHVRDLGLAYQFHGDDKYARRAVPF